MSRARSCPRRSASTPPPAAAALAPPSQPRPHAAQPRQDLSPPPASFPPGFQPTVFSGPSAAADPDRHSRPPPSAPAVAAATLGSISQVPETPPELLHGLDSGHKAFNACSQWERGESSLQGRKSPNFNSSGWGSWRSCFPPVGAPLGSRTPAPRMEETGRWIEVKSRSRRAPLSPALQRVFNGRPAPPLWLRNRCFHCHSKHHRAAACRDPVRCNNCWISGHRERECKQGKIPRDVDGRRIRQDPPPRLQAAAGQAPPPPQLRASQGHAPSASPAAVAPRQAAAVAMPRTGAAARRPGAPELRPGEDDIIIESTPEMLQETMLLESNAVAAAWFDSMVQGISVGRVKSAVAAACGALDNDVEVVKHHPEQYLITFIHPHHCSNAVGRTTIKVDHLTMQVRPWRMEAHAENVSMDYHVWVGLENVPLQGWNLHTVSRIVGKGASLDYIEARSVRKVAMDLLWAWVWTDNPNRIPKIKWVTMPARVPSGASSRARGRRGLRHRVLIHLAIVEDFTSSDKQGNPPPPYELPFAIGEVDGSPRERPRSPPPRQDERRGRRDDDDDRDGRGGRERDRWRGWRETIRRSLSRNRGRDSRAGGRDDREVHDSRDYRDGRHHDCSDDVPLGAIKPVVVEALFDARLVEATAAGSFELGSPAGRRGRSGARPSSPRSDRRLSRRRQTPPASPDSPVSVLPSSAASRKTGNSLLEEMGLVARLLCSPMSMLHPIRVEPPSKPPGFCISSTATTPRFVPASPDARTPVSLATRSGQPLDGELQALFRTAHAPILASPPPCRPTARRKTLAIHRTGFTMRRSSSRIKAQRKSMPILQDVEALVCRNLGIVMDGEVVTEEALAVFVRVFKDQVSTEAVQVLRILFKMDIAQDRDIEEAMLARGGVAAVEQFSVFGETQVDNV
ncbi:hypothetical protein ACQ4PT_048674 [Festuca glaucescens]